MNIFNRQKTLKPIKAHKGRRGELSEFAKATLSTLGSGSMIEAVKLPKNEDPNEWLAVNTVDFFNEISMLYGTISEYCTKGTCPVMSAGPKVQYLWADGVKVKKPIACTAPEYVDLLLTWVESQLNDEEIFPIKFDSSYPKNFKQICSVIYKRFFRVYAHIYHSHFKRIQRLGASAHLNTCFKHFIYFVHEFKLIEPKELQPLKDLIDSLMGKETKDGKDMTKREGKEDDENGDDDDGEDGSDGAEAPASPTSQTDVTS